ncbi:MAG: hypothetical protein MK136_18055, partial [Pirellulaceae bacterium]|nr:hypothetical protein [Pirellulaceae bacterium]
NPQPGVSDTDIDIINIVVHAINDPPLNSIDGISIDLANVTLTTDEDTPLTLDSASNTAISVSDLEITGLEAGSDVEVTLNVVHGKVTLNPAGSVTVSNGSATSSDTVTFQGDIDEVNVALDGLIFEPDPDFNDLRGTAQIQMTTSDLGNAGGPGPMLDVDVLNIGVEAVNDGPASQVSGSQATEEDVPLIFSAENGNAIQMVDVDAAEAGLDVSVNLTATNGTVTVVLDPDVVVTGNGSTLVTLNGSIESVNRSLALTTFTPAPHFNDLLGNASLEVHSDDHGQTGLDHGDPTTDTQTVLISVSPRNDAPVVHVPAAQLNLEDTQVEFSSTFGNVISIEDVDLDEAVPAGTREIEVVVSAVGGTISLDAVDVPALAYVSGDADAQDETNVTIRGSLAAVNAALNGLVFDPAEHHNDNLGVSHVSITADDLGNSPAGPSLTDQETVTINLVPVNDEPQHLLPAMQTATEDMPLIFSATNNNLISVNDVDVNEGGGLLEVQLLPTNGVVSVDLTSANVNLLVGSGFDDSLMILEGSLVDVNLALEVVTFTPDLNFNAAQGAAGITITTSDRGNTGQGGAQTDSDTILISVTEVNDPPLVSVPPDQAVSEDATLEFSDAFANAITVSDLDIAVTDDVEVTLAADFGVLSIVSAPGLTYEFGADATDEELIKFTGALQDVTAALETVTFRPDADFNDTQGQARLEVSINDLGNHGLGGPLEDVEEVLISV